MACKFQRIIYILYIVIFQILAERRVSAAVLSGAVSVNYHTNIAKPVSDIEINRFIVDVVINIGAIDIIPAYRLRACIDI